MRLLIEFIGILFGLIFAWIGVLFLLAGFFLACWYLVAFVIDRLA